MLAKKSRISKKKEIDNVFQKGESSFDGLLGIKYLASNQPSRFVVVVSAKVSKKAVVRNKIKRRLSEIARINLPNILQNGDFFVLALPAAKKASFNDLEKSFINHLKKLKATIKK